MLAELRKAWLACSVCPIPIDGDQMELFSIRLEWADLFTCSEIIRTMVLVKWDDWNHVMDAVYGVWPWMQMVELWILKWEGFESCDYSQALAVETRPAFGRPNFDSNVVWPAIVFDLWPGGVLTHKSRSVTPPSTVVFCGHVKDQLLREAPLNLKPRGENRLVSERCVVASGNSLVEDIYLGSFGCQKKTWINSFYCCFMLFPSCAVAHCHVKSLSCEQLVRPVPRTILASELNPKKGNVKTNFFFVTKYAYAYII